ncbi:MAG: hypothetical protein V1754_02080, partial [Pseudomonadota bacterium]
KDLEQVVMRCLAKDPADRYQDLWEVAKAFSACLQRIKMPTKQYEITQDIDELETQHNASMRSISDDLDTERDAPLSEEDPTRLDPQLPQAVKEERQRQRMLYLFLAVGIIALAALVKAFWG